MLLLVALGLILLGTIKFSPIIWKTVAVAVVTVGIGTNLLTFRHINNSEAWQLQLSIPSSVLALATRQLDSYPNLMLFNAIAQRLHGSRLVGSLEIFDKYALFPERLIGIAEVQPIEAKLGRLSPNEVELLRSLPDQTAVDSDFGRHVLIVGRRAGRSETWCAREGGETLMIYPASTEYCQVAP